VPLQTYCADRADTHLFAFKIAERRDKLLLMLRALLRCEKARDAVDEPELHLSKVRFAQKGERAPFGFWSGLDLVGVFLPSHSCFACWRETRILIKPDRRRHWLFSGLVTFKPRSAVLRHRNCLTQASARSFVHYFLLFTYG